MNNTFLTPEIRPVLPLDPAGIRKTLLLLRAVNHAVRHRIIEIIGRSAKLVVTDICNEVKLDPSAVSQHLAVLRQVGVVHTERQGKYIFYFLNPERLRLIHALTELEKSGTNPTDAVFTPSRPRKYFFWQ